MSTTAPPRWSAVVVNYEAGPLLAGCVRTLVDDTSAGHDTAGVDTAWILDAVGGDVTTSEGGGGGCALSTVPTGAPLLVLLALAALVARRRRA